MFSDTGLSGSGGTGLSRQPGFYVYGAHVFLLFIYGGFVGFRESSVLLGEISIHQAERGGSVCCDPRRRIFEVRLVSGSLVRNV